MFPRWAHWGAPGAATDYVDGIERRLGKDNPGAEAKFESARDAETENLLPRLQLANIHEAEASMNGAGAREQAEALREYLYIGVARPDVVAGGAPRRSHRRDVRNTLP